MKKLLILVGVSLFISNCTQYVYLKKSPSELVLTSIQGDNQTQFSYTFESNIPDTLMIGNYGFDVNASYISNLKIYMNTKYSVEDESENNIKFILVSCTQTTRDANSGMQNTANVLNALAGSSNSTYYNNVVLTTEISLKVIVKKENKTQSKVIRTTDEYNGDGSNLSVIQGSFDQAISKSIIMIDKLLSSL